MRQMGTTKKKYVYLLTRPELIGEDEQTGVSSSIKKS